MAVYGQLSGGKYGRGLSWAAIFICGEHGEERDEKSEVGLCGADFICADSAGIGFGAESAVGGWAVGLSAVDQCGANAASDGNERGGLSGGAGAEKYAAERADGDRGAGELGVRVAVSGYGNGERGVRADDRLYSGGRGGGDLSDESSAGSGDGGWNEYVDAALCVVAGAGGCFLSALCAEHGVPAGRIHFSIRSLLAASGGMLERYGLRQYLHHGRVAGELCRGWSSERRCGGTGEGWQSRAAAGRLLWRKLSVWVAKFELLRGEREQQYRDQFGKPWAVQPDAALRVGADPFGVAVAQLGEPGDRGGDCP